jgi:hypothetical protein
MRKISLFILSLLFIASFSYAGSLDQSSAPSSDTTRMYTLEQIYQKVTSGTTPAKQSGGFNEPSSGPTSGTMHTLDEIEAKIAAGTTTAAAGDVLTGKTFITRTTGNGESAVTGTMPTQTLSAANETVAAGYYAATTLSAVDSDLAVGNIKSGVTIFGFLGTYSGGGVPKTGQTTSYANYDDAWYVTNQNIGVPKSGAHYTNNGDGTITDNATGLEWVADPTAAGVGGTYSWADAITACEGLTYAGHSDWRLPNVKELQSIVDFSRVGPAIDTTYFTSQSDIYWSSTTHAGSTVFAWGVSFGVGNVIGDVDKTSPYYVRPVRGG